MYAGLVFMTGLGLAIGGIWLHAYAESTARKMLNAFRGLPLAAKIVVSLFVLNLIVFGSTKSTNSASPSATAFTTLDSRDDGEGMSSGIFPITELSESQLAVGMALAEVLTDELHDFAMPENAVVHRPWRLRGASEDVFPLVFTNWCFRFGRNVYEKMYVSSSGTISFETPMASAVSELDDVARLAPFHTTLGIVPDANRKLLATENSCFWHALSPSNTAIFTWRNVLFGRDTNFPITVQTELSENGDVACRYDLSSLADMTNWTNRVSIGVWNNRTGETHVASSSLPTSIFFKHLLPSDTPASDRDGDGISTADEIFVYRTDPDHVDTDCDGVSDYDEILCGTKPLLADTDGDGLVDGSDPDPKTVTSSSDLDDDGIPDAYESHWFGNANAVNVANVRDETGFTLADKMLGGINPTNAATGGEIAVLDSLAYWRLFDAFSVNRSRSATNLVWKRTFTINRTSAWQQFFVSSNPTNAAPWHLDGMALEWETEGGFTGSATSSPRWDSFRIPFPSYATALNLTLRLRSLNPGATVRAPQPLYLIGYAPEFRMAGKGKEISGIDGNTYWVFLDGADSEIQFVVDHALRPSNAPIGADEGDIMDGTWPNSDFSFDGDRSGGRVMVHRPGVCELAMTSLDLPLAMQGRKGRSSVRGGVRLVVLDPSAYWTCAGHGCSYDGLGYDWSHDSYQEEKVYPLDSTCLRKKWHYHPASGWECNGELIVSPGMDESDDGSVTVEGDSIFVGGVKVWTGVAQPHSYHAGSCGDGTYHEEFLGDECDTCEDDCANGNCDTLEGPELGSLRFRIPLGVPGKGQLSGFVWFAAEEPIPLSKSMFQVLSHPGANVSDETVSGVRRIKCADTRGRDLHIEDISGGVRIAIHDNGTQKLLHSWEIANEAGDSPQIRFHKVSRLGNTLLDETFIYENGDWERFDNVAKLGTRLETWGDISNPYDGVKYETRTTTDADGNVLSAVITEFCRLGDCDNALLRETYREESTPWNTTWTRADYWNDPAHSARHGRPRIVWGNARSWVYTDFDGFGHTTLRIEQRRNAVVPESFPCVVSNELFDVATLTDAIVTVYDYVPHAGDSCHGDDSALPRTETRYVVQNGVATFTGRTWCRYTRLVRDGHDAVKKEMRRAKHPGATFDDPSNAASYEITYTETGMDTPALMRGAVAESCDEDGLLTVNAYTLANGELSCETRRTGPSLFPTDETTVRDAVHGTLLRRTMRLAADDTIIDDEQSLYDDQNRLRSTTYIDGTSLTNAYSCCRLLWKIDRTGRRTLRSAATGFDHLYYAEEDVWLADVSTNEAFRITHHYFDALGRETNIVVTLGTTPGEAVPQTDTGVPSVDPAQIISQETTTYPYGGSDYSIRVDARGKKTITCRNILSDCIKTCEAIFTNDVEILRTKHRTYFGGGISTRREWGGGKWSEERRFDDYLPDGRRVAYVVTDSSDYGTVTNSISIHDFLGRLESTSVPGMNGSRVVTSNAYDGVSSRLLASTQFAPGLAPRTTTFLYNDCGERVGTEIDGITTRTDITYATISNEIWRVETSTVVGTFSNSVSVTRTRLTGLSDACRSHVATRSETTGVETETTTVFEPETKIETTTATSSITQPTVRRSQYGLVLASETSESTLHNIYDGLGRVADVTRETDESGFQPVQSFIYAPCGNLLSTFTYTNVTDGISESYIYDSLGNRVMEIDALDNSIHRSYDPFGRVTEVGGATYPVRYTYDSAGRRTSLATTRDGVAWDTTTWIYDPATGLCLSKTYADGTQTACTYTPDGLPLRTTYASGKWRECVYDARRNLAGMVYSSPDMAYEIQNDEFGRAVSESNAICSVGYLRADGGVATNEVVTVGSQTVTLVRGLDAFARQASLAVPDAPTVFLAYNQKGDVSVVSNEAFSVAYHFTPDGLNAGYTLTTAAGVYLRRTVARDAYRRSLITAVTNGVNGSTLHSFDYAHDAGSRVTMRNNDVFTYNLRNEVTGAILDDSSYLYAYDEIGNFVSNSRDGAQTLYTVNNLNQYTEIAPTNGVTSPVHDANGNLVSDGTFTYVWDDENRLVSVLCGGEVKLENEYDTQSRRVRKTTQTTTHTFIYDGWNLVKETIVATNGQAEVVDYMWGRDLSGTLQGAGGVGGLLAVRRNGSWFFPFYDSNGNIVAYVDSLGTLVASYAYDAFGNTTAQSGTMADSFAHRFSTKYFDADTGLYYYGYRFYSPTLSRWLNRDPIEEEGGVNLYASCENNPVLHFDKDGRAYFALRRLKGFIWIPGLSRNPLLDAFNIEVAHELVFLEDGGTEGNSGFSAMGVLPEDTQGETYYRTDGGYNDCVMRKAIAQVKGRFTGHSYSVVWFAPHAVKCNCQDYATALRRKYSELVSDKKVRCECGLGS